MSFRKDGETKVYKTEGSVGPKMANSGESNRYTVDDLVKDAGKNTVPSVEQDEEEEENVN
jgi:hypothetical protein